MAGAKQKPEGTAWRRRQQGSGPSAAAIEEVRSNLKETIAARRAAEAADLSTLALPAFPGHSASNEVKAAWAQAVLKVKAAMPRTEAEREMEFRLASQRRDYEACGFKWHEPVPISMWVARRLVLSDTVKRLTDRINALEKQLSETKTVANHTSTHALTFGGNFVLENAYNEGTVTIYKGAAFIAGRDISANLTFPPRQGSGWIPL